MCCFLLAYLCALLWYRNWYREPWIFTGIGTEYRNVWYRDSTNYFSNILYRMPQYPPLHSCISLLHMLFMGGEGGGQTEAKKKIMAFNGNYIRKTIYIVLGTMKIVRKIKKN